MVGNFLRLPKFPKQRCFRDSVGGCGNWRYVKSVNFWTITCDRDHMFCHGMAGFSDFYKAFYRTARAEFPVFTCRLIQGGGGRYLWMDAV
jgi:hypothetical protein